MAHSKVALIHEENRTKVCLICMRKAKGDCHITNTILERIQLYYIEDYSLDESCCPNAVCATCRSKLLDISQGKCNAEILPEVFDFSRIVPYTMATRSYERPICDCYICTVARCKSEPKLKRGRPCISTYESSKGTPVRLCSNCKSPFGRGLSHRCNVSTLRENLLADFENVDPNTKEIVATEIVREKIAQDGKTIALQTLGPNKLSLQVSNSSTTQKRLFTSQNISNLQNTLGSSNNEMVRKVMPFIRDACGKNSIQSYTDNFLYQRDKSISKFFSVISINFDEYSRPVVYCNDAAALISMIVECRSLNHHFLKLKIGIDSGRNFLKVCLSVYDTREDEPQPRKTILREASNTGVKKAIILAITQEVKETYCNIKHLLDLVKLNSLGHELFYSVDLKMANIISGVSTHSSSYPCIWCDCPKSEFHMLEKSRTYTARTLGLVKKMSDNFMSSKSKSLKEFRSCIHHPLFNGSDGDIILKHIVLPELHLLLRATNKLYKELEICYESVCKDWILKLGLVRPQLHSGEFTGNMCKKLLSNVATLRCLIENTVDEISSATKILLLYFADTFAALNEIRVACFGQQLETGFESKITHFTECYMKLNISVTTAVHVLFNHLIEFCNFFHSSLGIYSEQASESVHSDFSSLWESSGKVPLTHHKYSENLLDVVIRYNARHL